MLNTAKPLEYELLHFLQFPCLEDSFLGIVHSTASTSVCVG